MNQAVLFDLIECHGGKKIALATLNKPQALNSLDLEMVNLLLIQLTSWQQQDDIAMVVIDSRGDKAFCAGGDVVSMHQAMAEQHRQKNNLEHFEATDIPPMIQTFFSQEYKLDFLIHTYAKPILVWGNGIIMGGGLGVMAGASHRIVTESTRMAMPEVSIGLFPDVGGSWFLNRMPQGCGKFLGATATNFNGADALYVGLADHFIDHDKKSAVILKLKDCQWHDDDKLNQLLVSEVCNQFCVSDKQPVGQLQAHQQILTGLQGYDDPQQYVSALLALDTDQDTWLSKAQKALQYGSPLTVALVFEQLRRGKDKTLAECFQMELIMSCRCATIGEFQEGVRALLIDKDRQPKWLFESLDEVPDSVVGSFFVSPWQNSQHPLAELSATNVTDS